GASVLLAPVTNTTIRGLFWLGQDSILFGADIGMFAVSSKGSAPRRVAGVDSTGTAGVPVVALDGGTIAYATGGGTASSRRLAVTSRSSHHTTVFDIAATEVLGIRDGQIVYVTSTGELYAVPFDPKRQRLTGDPVQVESGIRVNTAGAAL